MKEKLRNQSINDENVRSSTKHRKKVSQGGCFSQMAGQRSWSVKKVPHFLNVQLRTV